MVTSRSKTADESQCVRSSLQLHSLGEQSTTTPLQAHRRREFNTEFVRETLATVPSRRRPYLVGIVIAARDEPVPPDEMPRLFDEAAVAPEAAAIATVVQLFDGYVLDYGAVRGYAQPVAERGSCGHGL